MSDYTLHEGFPAIRLPPGTQLRLVAIDPTTGLSVSGVTSSNWAIYGDDDSGADLTDVVPLYQGGDEAG